MDVVGSEIGQKMRSAIKAKLTELGCYVDDELPDYVMVMVANKRTRAQMEDDLQLFLADNTVGFVSWLHQVLRKLQEVTVAPLTKKAEGRDKSKDGTSFKEPKLKEKRDKSKEKQKKTDGSKKSKKKSKEKSHKKDKSAKKHKTKKNKVKETEMIRPNVPPLLMNMEKVSEPSITDVFAGQILKNHGITIDTPKEEVVTDTKPSLTEINRPIQPVIDVATINTTDTEITGQEKEISNSEVNREEQLKEINEIENKIQGLRQKLVEQLDTMSDDEDFLNIRTEADELMTDFADDVIQEIAEVKPSDTTTALQDLPKSPAPQLPPVTPCTVPQASREPEVLPQIELNLPKRPIRERLGLRDKDKVSDNRKRSADAKTDETPNKKIDSSERYTPERDPDFWRSAKSRPSESAEQTKKASVVEDSSSDSNDSPAKTTTSNVVRGPPCSVVRVRPVSLAAARPRPPARPPSLLLRAMADAHRSLLSLPPKKEMASVKRGIVLPMRRDRVDNQKIVIVVPTDRTTGKDSGRSPADIRVEIDGEKSSSKENETEYIPTAITKKIINTNYVPSRRDHNSDNVDENIVVETINNHKTPTAVKEKGPTFVVTLDGLDPNIFLAKKLKNEGLIDDESEMSKGISKQPNPSPKTEGSTEQKPTPIAVKKRLSDTSEDSDTQVIIQASESQLVEKRIETPSVKELPPPERKRRASPIVFDFKKERARERTESAGRERKDSVGSEGHVTVTTVTSTNKYDSLPPLSVRERRVSQCRTFPQCRYGAGCAFSHPPCKFAAACTRRHCTYSHPNKMAMAMVPAIASHVVPAANFKSVPATAIPNMCKYYPNCVNPACHFYHPKPCRYGKLCINKIECNYYHGDMPATRWRVS